MGCICTCFDLDRYSAGCLCRFSVSLDLLLYLFDVLRGGFTVLFGVACNCE